MHFNALYFRHKRAKQWAPGTTMLLEDALVTYSDSEDGNGREFGDFLKNAVSFSRFHCCGRHGIGPTAWGPRRYSRGPMYTGFQRLGQT